MVLRVGDWIGETVSTIGRAKGELDPFFTAKKLVFAYRRFGAKQITSVLHQHLDREELL